MKIACSRRRMYGALIAVLLAAAIGVGYYLAFGQDQGRADLLHATDADFKTKVLDHRGLVVVDLHAEWCRPCHVLKPIIADLAHEYDGKVRFVYLDFDKAPDTVGELDYELIPTVYIFRDGELVHKRGGLPSPDQLRQTIDLYLSRSDRNDGKQTESPKAKPVSKQDQWDLMHACNPVGICEDPSHG